MDILDTAVNLMNEQLNLDVDAETVSSAVNSLLGDGQGGVDLAALSSRMMSSGGLGEVLQSWLGDGANSPISADTVTSLLGEGGLAEFASRLNIDTDTAASSLSEVLPQLMDQSSSGGELLGGLGGGLLDAAKSFLK